MDNQSWFVPFEDAVNTSDLLSYFWKEKTHSDLTIACQGKIFKVHKMVLIYNSSYFKHILENISCSQPVIYLFNLHVEIVERILEFLYIGTVHIDKNDLKSFLSTATALGIKGVEMNTYTLIYEQSSPKEDRAGDKVSVEMSKGKRIFITGIDEMSSKSQKCNKFTFSINKKTNEYKNMSVEELNINIEARSPKRTRVKELSNEGDIELECMSSPCSKRKRNQETCNHTFDSDDFDGGEHSCNVPMHSPNTSSCNGRESSLHDTINENSSNEAEDDIDSDSSCIEKEESQFDDNPCQEQQFRIDSDDNRTEGDGCYTISDYLPFKFSSEVENLLTNQLTGCSPQHIQAMENNLVVEIMNHMNQNNLGNDSDFTKDLERYEALGKELVKRYPTFNVDYLLNLPYRSSLSQQLKMADFTKKRKRISNRRERGRFSKQ